MPAGPPLTVVLPTRDGLREIEPAARGLESQARRIGAEVLVVGAVTEPPPAWMRAVYVEDDDIYKLRSVGLREARGEIVAVGEDHAVPREDWCEAVLRAHAEHPDSPAVAGCLVNATAATLSGRANFLAFAAPFQPPVPASPPLRPPPVSNVSLKRAALADLGSAPGDLEAILLPRLFEEGLIAADERILVDHYQDHGLIWAIANSFHSARASYGRLRGSMRPRERLVMARWSLVHWPHRMMREARARTTDPRELGAVAMIAGGCTAGAVMGSLAGPGRSRARVA